MFLEAAEQALADAGYDRKPLDRERCGVMVGTEFGGDFSNELEMGLRLPEMKHVISQLLQARRIAAEKIEQINTQFENTLLRKWPSLIDETGSFTTSTLASRISKTLDLAGGAVAIDSGSTSALSGLSICVDMLLSGDNDMMICARASAAWASPRSTRWNKPACWPRPGHEVSSMPDTTASYPPKGSGWSSSNGSPTPDATATAFMRSCAESAWPTTHRTPKHCDLPWNGRR